MPATLIVEDGTIVANANSYVTVAEVTAFCVNYGLDSWSSLGNTEKITATIRATAFIDSEYNFKGIKMSFDSPLEWPRWGVYDESDVDLTNLTPEEMYFYQEIPQALKNACCRAAYEESVSVGVLQSNLVSGIKREKTDVLETEYFGSTPSSAPSKTVYRTIEGFLKNLITNKNTAIIKRT